MKVNGQRILMSFLICLLMNQTADATVVMVVVKPDAIWIAADAVRSSNDSWALVCKVHAAYGGVLLKYGYNGEPNSSWSTDKDVENLLHSKKSYPEFKAAVIDILRKRVAAGAAIDAPRLTNMQQVEADRALNTVGLVFVGVSNGHLFAEELKVVPSLLQASGPIPQFTVPKPTWEVITDQHGFHLYPPSISLPQQLERFYTDHPERLEELLVKMEKETPCRVGTPNVFLKVTVQNVSLVTTSRLKDFNNRRNEADLDWRDPGACPSWSAVTVQRPSACTTVEQLREDTQGGGHRLPQ